MRSAVEEEQEQCMVRCILQHTHEVLLAMYREVARGSTQERWNARVPTHESDGFIFLLLGPVCVSTSSVVRALLCTCTFYLYMYFEVQLYEYMYYQVLNFAD